MTHAAVAAPPIAAATSDADPAASPAGRAERLKADAPVATVLLACAWWLVVATRLTGGRGPGSVTGGAILTGLAILTIQPHRYLPRAAVWLALAVSAAAVGVALTAPTGWAGAPTAASYVCVSWLVVAIAAAVARDRRVPNLVLLLLVASVGVEVGESWLAWWGGRNASAPMIGTFYWWNSFAAFLLPGTVVGLSYWLRRTGPVAVFGLFICSLGTIGTVYSTSRAVDACLGFALVCVCLAHIVSHRLSGARRVLSALVVSSFGVWVIGGPPFFPQRSLPLAGTNARAVGQSLGQNGSYRVDFWREALGVFGRHPLIGGGFHSLASGSVGHTPAHWPLSPLAHSGYLQALSDGGLLLGVPFLISVAFIAWYVVSALVRAVRRRDFSAAGFALPLCLGALLAHSAIDFDWSFAADFALAAILAGVVVGTRSATPRAARRRPGTRLVAGAVLVGVALTAVAAVAAWSGDYKQSLPIGPASNSSDSATGGQAVHPFGR